jgi:maltooligosyltrehalose trehalohydrolase
MRQVFPEVLANGKCRFRVWAPGHDLVTLHLHDSDQKLAMEKDRYGYFSLTTDAAAGSRYTYILESGEYPDPGSPFQPDGVHGPSEVVDHGNFAWSDATWKGLPFRDLVLYELHVGTFTREGTFEAIIPRLPELRHAGVNAIEIMPIAQFPGERNWGYDAVYPYAVQNSYGGPEGLKALVDACHQEGIAVFLDLIYNHLGPEGNYFGSFGPYFTHTYKTPWGDAINFDGEWSDGVRDYFGENALYWFRDYHVDGLRLDAIHMVFDNGAVHFWELLSQRVAALQDQLGRPLHLVAESDLNSPKVTASPQAGGFGFTGQWLDDFHHALYVLLDEKGRERYGDFGTVQQFAKAISDGFVHSGEYVRFRKRKHGRSSAGVPGDQFIAFNQNHDQVGNRVGGERLCMLVNFSRQKLANAALLLAPYVPMLFMGEEYSDQSPFFYFVDHSDPKLIEAVREGRKNEFANYNGNETPPDPQATDTFTDCVLKWEKRNTGKHKVMLDWTTALLKLRAESALLKDLRKEHVQVSALENAGVAVLRQSPDGDHYLLCLFNFSEEPLRYTLPFGGSSWRTLLDSTAAYWNEDRAQPSESTTTYSVSGEITIGKLAAVVLELE